MTNTDTDVYLIPNDVLDRDYHGAGKAWAAIAQGEVVAIRYVDNFDELVRELPEWVNAANDNAEGRQFNMLPTAWSSNGLSKLATAVRATADCPKRPRGGDYKPSELLTMARAALLANSEARFASYREEMRTELAELGEVRSGMCSACEFVAVPVPDNEPVAPSAKKLYGIGGVDA
tara:strand:- start:4268 stop:4795 length:528 start_codon:yes stop_codon:yes gene_type:complete